MNSRRELWKEKHGPIPKGWVSVNLNGNPGDLRIENIAVIPRSPNLKLILAPFIERVRTLERKLNAFNKTKEENK